MTLRAGRTTSSPEPDFTDLDIVTGTLERDESPQRSLFIDDDIFLARDARNPGTYESPVHSLVDGGTPAHEGSYLVSSGLVPVDEFLPPGVTWCDCSYTKWGWWGGELANAADTAQYRSHLATFVAGTLPGLPDIPRLRERFVLRPSRRPGDQPRRPVRRGRKLREDLEISRREPEAWRSPISTERASRAP